MSSVDYELSETFAEAARLLLTDPSGAFEKASSVQNDGGCTYLKGLMTCTGTGVPKDVDAGLKLLDSSDCPSAAIVAAEIRSGADVSSVLDLRVRAEAWDLEACRAIFPLYDTGKNADGTKAVVRKDHAEAVRLYAPCAAAGDREAQETIGYMYLMGKGVPKDRDLAVSLLSAAAEQGSGRAAYRIAYMYDSGQCYTDPDLKKAMEWYYKASDLGDAEASFQIAGVLFMKDTEWYNPASGRKYIEKAAESGFPEAEHQLGLMYVYGGNGFKKDPVKGKAYLVKACEDGVQNAQVDYANMCFEGTLLPRDLAESAKWFTAAAEGFSGTAMYALGCMYANGLYYDTDERKAFDYFTQAAEGGEVNAQYALACFYYEGRGTEKDTRKAAVWFQESADQGHPGSMAFLGMFKVTGRDVEQDVEGGLALLKQAADGGYYEAQFYLGKLYAEGEYVKKDLAYAKKMLKLAAEQGDPDAVAMLDDIKKKRIR